MAIALFMHRPTMFIHQTLILIIITRIEITAAAVEMTYNYRKRQVDAFFRRSINFSESGVRATMGRSSQ